MSPQSPTRRWIVDGSLSQEQRSASGVVAGSLMATATSMAQAPSNPRKERNFNAVSFEHQAEGVASSSPAPLTGLDMLRLKRCSRPDTRSSFMFAPQARLSRRARTRRSGSRRDDRRSFRHRADARPRRAGQQDRADGCGDSQRRCDLRSTSAAGERRCSVSADGAIRRPKRLIYLSSSMHTGGRASLSGMDWTGRTSTGSYSDSKLFVTTLAAAVARLWPDVFSNSVDPGWVPTKMGGANAPDDLRLGHLTQEWLATSDDPEALTSGGYWHHQKRRKPHPSVLDTKFQDQLLDELARATGTPLA